MSGALANKSSITKLSRIIGSRFFLEPRILITYVVPFSIINSVYAASPSSGYEVYLWTIANLLAIFVVGLFIGAFRVSWSKVNYPQLPLMIVALISALVGVAKSFLTLQAMQLLSSGEVAMQDTLATIAGAAIIAVPGLMFASAWGYLLREFRREREILITARGIEQMRKGSAQLQEKISQLANELRDLAKDLSKKREKLIPEMEMRLIRSLVDTQVRPLATSVFVKLERDHQSFAMRELLQTATRSKPPAFLVSLPLLFTASQVITDYGLSKGLPGVIVATLLSIFFTFLIGEIFEQTKLQGIIGYYLTVITGPILGVFATFSLGGEEIDQPGLTIYFLIINSLFFGTVIGITKTAVTSAQKNRQAVLGITESRGQGEYEVLARQRRAIANQIHGEVQSRLLNIVLQSEAGSKITRAHAIEELERVADLLENSQVYNDSFENSIQRLIGTWRGFTRLEVDLGAKDVPESLQQVVFSIIEEGVTNAFKHGMASKVLVRMDGNDLVISDNGIGPTNGKTGLGSRLLSSITDSWSLRPKPEGGSELRLRLID